MGLILILIASTIGLIILVCVVYFSIKVIFPRMLNQERENYYEPSRRKSALHTNKNNPYSFPKDRRQ